MFESLLEELAPLAAHRRIKGLLARETALSPTLLPLTALTVGLLTLLLEGTFVGKNQHPAFMVEVVEPAGMLAVFEAQMNGGKIRRPIRAQEFFASCATSSSRGAREARFSLTASRPALTTSDADAPFSLRCSYAASPNSQTFQR